MSNDRTQIQGEEELRRAQQLSLSPARPPIDVPGYETERFLGSGAYGEVWVAIDRTTGRRVAIKFYAHRGGLDWSLLSREVEKLVLLSADRYVVQLLDVGWDAEPPYYVMEYMEHGSLDDRLRAKGPLSAGEALSLFREVAIGLQHAHGKGVLHCDLKPANVMLDQDSRPRLADFGQSRLSHEQTPALGTLFYMAPEQADLRAVPDVVWDVYALGALLYSMLTGEPPHRSPQAANEIDAARDLEERLARYRAYIERQSTPSAHRHVAGVDRALVEIVDRCLTVDPLLRFPNVQAVIAALDHRDARRTRRPLVVLGMIGPALLMLVMGLGAWHASERVIHRADGLLTERALESNLFAAQLAASAAASDLDLLYRDVERVATDQEFQTLMAGAIGDPELADLRAELTRPQGESSPDGTLFEQKRERLREHAQLRKLQAKLEAMIKEKNLANAASWFINDAQGLQLARSPLATTIGVNWAWRSYFHGGLEDFLKTWRPQPGQHIRQTQLSAVFESQATQRWILGVSTPVFRGDTPDDFLGIVALTVEVGGEDFGVRVGQQQPDADQGQFAVLVDWRESKNKGLIVQHPLLNQLDELPARFKDYKVAPHELPGSDVTAAAKIHYQDPLGRHERGDEYGGRWLATSAPVFIRGHDSGLKVIVQERHERAIGPALAQLRTSFAYIGLFTLGGAVLVLTVLWAFVGRPLRTGGLFSSRVRAGLPELETVETISMAPQPAGAQRKRTNDE